MAYLDAHGLYSDSQVAAASAASTNLIDHGQDRNLGLGEPLAAVVTVEAIDAANADETYAFALQTDDAEGFPSAVQVGGSVNIPRASAVGSQFVLVLPIDLDVERFTRLFYTLGGTTPSITVTSRLVPAKFVERFFAFPDAVTIS